MNYYSVAACTPEIYINTGTNNESQQSVVESPQKEVADNTQGDSESAQNTTSKTEADKITKDEAKAIAFKHAAVTAQSVYDLDIELDRDNGKEVYEIEFKFERVEYKYKIHAETGEILKSEKESDN